MGVNHRGTDISVPQELLNRPDVVSVFQQMCGEGMTQRVAARRLSDTCFEGCLPHCSLEDRLVDYVVGC